MDRETGEILSNAVSGMLMVFVAFANAMEKNGLRKKDLTDAMQVLLDQPGVNLERPDYGILREAMALLEKNAPPASGLH